MLGTQQGGKPGGHDKQLPPYPLQEAQQGLLQSVWHHTCGRAFFHPPLLTPLNPGTTCLMA